MAIDEHFLIEDAAEPGCFTFRHALTRDTILDGVLAMQARAMHLVIAHQIEREPDSGERVVELAEHYWRAAAFAECAANAEPAGDLAKARHAYAEAAELYERALACGTADERGLVALHEKAASAYMSMGAPQKVLEHIHVAVDYYTAIGDAEKLVEVYLDLAIALRRTGQTESESAALRRAAELSASIGNGKLHVQKRRAARARACHRRRMAGGRSGSPSASRRSSSTPIPSARSRCSPRARFSTSPRTSWTAGSAISSKRPASRDRTAIRTRSRSPSRATASARASSGGSTSRWPRFTKPRTRDARTVRSTP